MGNIYLLAYEDGADSVPKRRHIKFRRRGITQKKTYDILNLPHTVYFCVFFMIIKTSLCCINGLMD
jgi:hypothetical protein